MGLCIGRLLVLLLLPRLLHLRLQAVDAVTGCAPLGPRCDETCMRLLYCDKGSRVSVRFSNLPLHQRYQGRLVARHRHRCDLKQGCLAWGEQHVFHEMGQMPDSMHAWHAAGSMGNKAIRLTPRNVGWTAMCI